jgi:guanylate kinase
MSQGVCAEKGHLIIVSGPSGAGKSTIINRILGERPRLVYSVSFTTRPRRGPEREGVDYHFISRKAFQEKIDSGELAEWAQVHGDLYGTSSRIIDENLSRGNDVIVDVDTEGAKKLLSRYDGAVSVFIRPPTMEALKERLTGRETDTAEAIEKRLKNARAEMGEMDGYTYVIVNDDLQGAISQFLSILDGIGSHG